MKRSLKGWLKTEFDSSNSCNGNLNKKPRLTEPGTARNVANGKDSINFLNQLAPKSVSDLAVHPKKIKEVEDWLRNSVICSEPDAQFLLITGPTGSGKTASVNVLCKSSNIEILEWVNPIDKDYETSGGYGQIDRLINFITDSKYTSLLSNRSDRKKVVLIEDYPNALIHDPAKLPPVLETCSVTGQAAVIFICTENSGEKLSLSQSLFPPEVRKQFNIHHISFNECSATLLKNALKRAQDYVKKCPDLFQVPSQNVLDAVVSSALGDIRCAMNQYYFACLKGMDDLPMTVVETAKASNKSKGRKLVLKSMSRDQVLGLFHSLGRVFNPKHAAEGANGRGRLQCDLEQLIDELNTQPLTTSGFLFENYVKYFGCLNDARKAAETLSQSRILLEKGGAGGEVSAMALWIAVLGLMVYNEHRVSKWTQITGPPKAIKSDAAKADLESRSLSPTDRCYHNYITKTNAHHRFICKC